jgi:hypothetical protein
VKSLPRAPFSVYLRIHSIIVISEAYSGPDYRWTPFCSPTFSWNSSNPVEWMLNSSQQSVLKASIKQNINCWKIYLFSQIFFFMYHIELISSRIDEKRRKRSSSSTDLISTYSLFHSFDYIYVFYALSCGSQNENDSDKNNQYVYVQGLIKSWTSSYCFIYVLHHKSANYI